MSSNTISPWRSTSEEELRAYREVSAKDWQTFLLLRAAELKQGDTRLAFTFLYKTRARWDFFILIIIIIIIVVVFVAVIIIIISL